MSEDPSFPFCLRVYDLSAVCLELPASLPALSASLGAELSAGPRAPKSVSAWPLCTGVPMLMFLSRMCVTTREGNASPNVAQPGEAERGLRGTGESRGVNLTLPRALPKRDHKGGERVRTRGQGRGELTPIEQAL